MSRRLKLCVFAGEAILNIRPCQSPYPEHYTCHEHHLPFLSLSLKIRFPPLLGQGSNPHATILLSVSFADSLFADAQPTSADLRHRRSTYSPSSFVQPRHEVRAALSIPSPQHSVALLHQHRVARRQHVAQA